jgi:hypothetical protein
MTAAPKISVVAGMQFAQANLPAILAALGPGLASGRAELLLCHASDDPLVSQQIDGVRVVAGAPDATIPQLWRDGIVAARAPVVALLSGHCIPAADWLDTALSLDMVQHVAYGGPIVNAPASDRVGTAIHLLRYSGFAHIETSRTVPEIAADNAVYRRDAILACTDLLPEGFWEPSYHARFRLAGESLALVPGLVVTHVNLYSPAAFMRQRRRHGAHFGQTRANGAPVWRRWLMLLTSPAAFPVFAIKRTRQVFGDTRFRQEFPKAAPWLYLFMANWSLGEALGYARAVFGWRK